MIINRIKKKIAVVSIFTIIMTAIVSQSTFAENNNDDLKLEKQMVMDESSLSGISKDLSKIMKPDEILVQYEEDVSENIKKSKRKSVDAELIEKDSSGVELLKVNNKNIDKVINELGKDRSIKNVSPNFIRKTSYIPNDPKLTEQWSIDAVNAKKAWDVINDCDNLKEVKVAVLDTGIDMNHEDLKDKISDDTYDIYNDDNDPSSVGEKSGEHGTHVAGIIAATSGNGVGVSGTAGKAPVKIMPVKVLQDGSGDDFTIIKGIYYAVDNGADIINMSLAGPGVSPMYNEAIEYALSKNVLVVAAAGNSTMDTKSYVPASVPGVLTVSATDSENKLAEFSNFGSVVDITAPGVDIMSTVNENQYSNSTGTSMASPAVCGVAAMVKSKEADLDVAELQDIIYTSAKDIGEKGKDIEFGYGLIDAYKALNTQPSNKKIRILDISENDRVYYKTDVITSCMDSDELEKVEVYIDGKKINQEVVNNCSLNYAKQININNYKDGNHILKVKAYYKNDKTYEDSVNINIVNNVGKGLRTKVSTNGKPAFGQLSVYENIDGKLIQTTGGMTDRYGYIDINEEMLTSTSNIVLSLQSIEQNKESLDIYTHVKEINKTGLYNFENSDLSEIKFKPFKVDNYIIMAKYKLENGQLFDGDMVFESFNFDEMGKDIKLFTSPGDYNFIFRATNYNENIVKERFLLNKNYQVKSNTISNVEFDKSNITKLNFKYKETDSIKYKSSFITFEENSLSLQIYDIVESMFYTIPANITYCITPGEYTPYYSPFLDNNNTEMVAAFTSETQNFKNKNHSLKYGGKYEGKTYLDKSKYNVGENIEVDFRIRDKYKNKLEFLVALQIKEAEGNNTDVNNKLEIANVIKNQFIKNDEVTEGIAVDILPLTKVKVIDKKKNVVYEKEIFDLTPFEIELTDDFKKGKYRVIADLEFPNLIKTNAKFKVN